MPGCAARAPMPPAPHADAPPPKPADWFGVPPKVVGAAPKVVEGAGCPNPEVGCVAPNPVLVAPPNAVAPGVCAPMPKPPPAPPNPMDGAFCAPNPPVCAPAPKSPPVVEVAPPSPGVG